MNSHSYDCIINTLTICISLQPLLMYFQPHTLNGPLLFSHSSKVNTQQTITALFFSELILWVSLAPWSTPTLFKPYYSSLVFLTLCIAFPSHILWLHIAFLLLFSLICICLLKLVKAVSIVLYFSYVILV